MTLQEVFESKDSLSKAVKDNLSTQMENYGYVIINTLLTAISLPPDVQKAMDSKITNLQLRLVTVEKAEADRIAVVARANAEKEATVAKAEAEARQTFMRAEAQAKALEMEGQGLAKKQVEANQGLTHAAAQLKETRCISVDKATELVMSNSYLDTLRSIGSTDKATILVPYTANVQDALRNVFIHGQEISK